MLVIRLQRTGRAGYPMYRLVVQDSKTQPTSGRVVSPLGQYNPHSKELNINKADVEKFLANGAQPSPRVVRLLTGAGVEMPKWVKKLTDKKADTRNKDKWRRFQPKEETPAAEEAVETTEAAESAAEAPAENKEAEVTAEAKTESPEA